MEQPDRDRLAEAVKLLEFPGWTARVSSLIGMPLEWALKRLPKGTDEIVSQATLKAVGRALEIAVSTLDRSYRGSPLKWVHSGAVGLFGGVGGFFGLPGMALELPVSTVVMLRSIADIARSEGEDVAEIETQLACVQVFGLGGKGKGDDAAEAGYYAARMGLAGAVSEAGQYISRRGLAEEGAPVIVRLIARISARFHLVVTEKLAAQIAPVIGAAGGAAVNLLFIRHFQSVARGHFIVRSLERKYGRETVREEYESLAGSLKKSPRGNISG
jgi:EcsC protein family